MSLDSPINDLISPAEISRLFGVSPRTVRNLIARGHLPAVRLGRQVRVSRRVLETTVGAQASADLLARATEGGHDGE